MFFFLMIRPPPRSTLFPSPTLFRSPRVDLLPVHGEPAPLVDRADQLAGDADGAGVGGDGGVVGAEQGDARVVRPRPPDRKSTRLNSSHANISYAVFCLKKKINYIRF